MSWDVSVKPKVEKAKVDLPEAVQDSLVALIKDIEATGPVQGSWPNYSKLKGSGNKHHCHLKKGKPTYVACWEVTDKKVKLVEVYYAGTHEKAPY